MFLNKIRNIFCVPNTKVVSATNVARSGKRGNICVGNNVSSFARALRRRASVESSTKNSKLGLNDNTLSSKERKLAKFEKV